MKIHKKTAVLLLLLLFSASCSTEDEKTSLSTDQTESNTLSAEPETTAETASSSIEESTLTPDEVKVKYSEYLTGILQETPEMQGHFNLAFIDGDDYPELLLCINNEYQNLNSYNVTIYTYHEGEIKVITDYCTLEPIVRYAPYRNKLIIDIYDSEGILDAEENSGTEERIYSLEDLYNYAEKSFYHVENGCGILDKQFTIENSEDLGITYYTINDQRTNEAAYQLEFSKEYSGDTYIWLSCFEYPLTMENISAGASIWSVQEVAEALEEVVEVVEEVEEVIVEEEKIPSFTEQAEETFNVPEDAKEKYIEYLEKILTEEPYTEKYFTLTHIDDDEYPEIIFTTVFNFHDPWSNSDFNYRIRIGTYFEDEIHTVSDYETSASEIYYAPKQNFFTTYIGTDNLTVNRYGIEHSYSINKESSERYSAVYVSCIDSFVRNQKVGYSDEAQENRTSVNLYTTTAKDYLGNSWSAPLDEESFWSEYAKYQEKLTDMNCRMLNNFAYKADEDTLREVLGN